MELTETKNINSKVNRRKGIPGLNGKNNLIILQMHQHINTAPSKTICISNSEIKTITDRVSPLKYEMNNKLTEQRHIKTYKDRFHVSEGINGYLKNTNGILHLLGSNKTAVKNEIHLRNTMYNLTRMT